MSINDIFKDIAKGITTAGHLLSTAVKLGNAIKSTWAQVGTQTITVAAQVFYDVVKSVTLAEQAAQAGAGGSWAGAVTLSQQTIASVQTLVSDFKAGEKQIVDDFKTLELSFTQQS